MAVHETRRAMVDLSTNATIHPFFYGKQVKLDTDDKARVEQHEHTDPLHPAETAKQETGKTHKRRKRDALSSSPDMDAVEHSQALTQDSDESGARATHGEVADVTKRARDEAAPTKPLQLNGKGGLESPWRALRPKDAPPDSEQSTTTVNARKQKRKSLCVRIAYGQRDLQQRVRLGQKVNQILTSARSTKDEDDGPQSRPKPKLNVLHPFFNRTAPKATGESTFTDDRTDEKGTPPPQPLNKIVTNAHIPLRKHEVNGSSSRTENVYIPLSSRSRAPRTREALWPPRGISRVEADRQRSLSLRHTDTYSTLRMKRNKTRVPSISVGEDILALEKCKLQFWPKQLPPPQDTDPSSRSCRVPRRRILTRPELQREYNDVPVAQHPALSRLYTNLASALSPYDNGECSSTSWSQQYAPQNSREMLGNEKELRYLRSWLQDQVVDTIASEIPPHKPDTEKHRRKRRKRKDDLDDFVVSDDEFGDAQRPEEDKNDLLGCNTTESASEWTAQIPPHSHTYGGEKHSNIIILSGSHGVGKSAAVQAVARELGFSIFEINAGTRRSGKDLLEKVGDLARNHQVHNGRSATQPTSLLDPTSQNKTQQHHVNNYFHLGEKAQPSSSQNKQNSLVAEKQKQSSQKQALILLEEVDVLFDDDKQFWETLVALAQQSRRPIVLTCNDESLIRSSAFQPHAILRFRAPPLELVANYLRLIAATEGHMLPYSTTSQLYIARHNDLRASIQDLNFWCQMAIGDTKGGMDWLLSDWPKASRDTENAVRPRVISEGSFDIRRTQLGTTSIDNLQAIDAAWQKLSRLPVIEETTLPESFTIYEYSSLVDNLGAADQFPIDTTTVVDQNLAQNQTCNLPLDPSIPLLSEASRLQYLEGYQLLQAYEDHDTIKVSGGYAKYIADMISIRPTPHVQDDTDIIDEANKVGNHSSHVPCQIPYHTIDKIFEQPSLLVPKNTVSLDYLPYLRIIAAYDLALEQVRSSAIKQDARSARLRTTRAARSAVEGGDRKTTRREKWFTVPLNLRAIVETGGRDWTPVFSTEADEWPPISEESMNVPS